MPASWAICRLRWSTPEGGRHVSSSHSSAAFVESSSARSREPASELLIGHAGTRHDVPSFLSTARHLCQRFAHAHTRGGARAGRQTTRHAGASGVRHPDGGGAGPPARARPRRVARAPSLLPPRGPARGRPPLRAAPGRPARAGGVCALHHPDAAPRPQAAPRAVPEGCASVSASYCACRTRRRPGCASCGPNATWTTTPSSAAWTRWWTSPARTGRRRSKFLQPNLGGIGGVAPAAHGGPRRGQTSRCPNCAGRPRAPSQRNVEMPATNYGVPPGAPGGPGPALPDAVLHRAETAGSGPEEQVAVAEYFRPCTTDSASSTRTPPSCAARTARCSGDEVIDIGYRDYEVKDLLELQASGVDVIAHAHAAARQPDGVLDLPPNWTPRAASRSSPRPEAGVHRTSPRRSARCSGATCCGRGWWAARRTVPLPDGYMGDLLEYAQPHAGDAGAQPEPRLRRPWYPAGRLGE